MASRRAFLGGIAAAAGGLVAATRKPPHPHPHPHPTTTTTAATTTTTSEPTTTATEPTSTTGPGADGYYHDRYGS